MNTDQPITERRLPRKAADQHLAASQMTRYLNGNVHSCFPYTHVYAILNSLASPGVCVSPADDLLTCWSVAFVCRGLLLFLRSVCKAFDIASI